MENNFFSELKLLFQKLPGIGPRQAGRFIYSLIDFSQQERENMGKLISSLSLYLKKCELCFRIFSGESSVCSFCEENSHREKSKIMVIEKDSDLLNFENTGMYKGTYFVLGGLFDPLDENKIPKIRIETLKKSIKKFSEVILALPSSKLGDFTSEYIKKTLLPGSIKVTRLGRGISYGVDIEYADESTLKHAFENRK